MDPVCVLRSTAVNFGCLHLHPSLQPMEIALEESSPRKKVQTRQPLSPVNAKLQNRIAGRAAFQKSSPPSARPSTASNASAAASPTRQNPQAVPWTGLGAIPLEVVNVGILLLILPCTQRTPLPWKPYLLLLICIGDLCQLHLTGKAPGYNENAQRIRMKPFKIAPDCCLFRALWGQLS